MNSSRTRSLLALCVTLSTAAACNGGPPAGDVGGADATDSSPADARSDAFPDAPVDASTDAASDASADASDAVSDTGGSDAGPGMLTVTSSGALVSTWLCGDPFPTGGTITVRNEGGSPVSYHTGITGPYAANFAATGATTGTLAAGATATIHAGPVRWTPEASTLVTRTAVLHVVIDGDGFGGGDVPLEITPHGAIVVTDGLEENFGDVRVGSFGSLGFSTLNLGDRDATLTFGSLADPQFATPIVAGDAVLAAAGSRFDVVTFTPTRSGPSTTTLPFSAAGPLCFSDVGTRVFHGAGLTGSVSVSGDLDFGNTVCGTSATSRIITLTNAGTAPANFTASLGAGTSSRYRLSSTGATIAPGAMFTITVTPDAIPATVSSLPGDFGDVVTIRTDVPGDSPHVVRLAQGARGGVLSWDRSSATLVAAPGRSTTASLTLSNNGSDPVTVQLVSSLSETEVSPSDPTVVPAHGRIAVTVSYTPSRATESLLSAVFPMSLPSGSCQPLPPPVTIIARGASGALAIDHESVDFGRVDCGSAAGDQVVNVTNPTPASVHVRARLGDGAHGFTLSSGSGTPGDTVTSDLAPGATLALTVHAPAVASEIGSTDPRTDTLVITSDAPTDPAHELPIRLQPNGAIVNTLAASAAIGFGTIPTGTSTSRIFAFANTGSTPVDIRLTTGTDFYWSRDLLTLPPDGTPIYSTLTGFARAIGTTTANFDVQIVGSTPLCHAAPDTHTVRVTGSSGAPALSASAIDFGRNPCRQAPPPAQVVQLSNVGSAPFDFNASAGSYFDVTPTTGTVAPGASIPLQVSARPIIDAIPGQRRIGNLVVTTDAPTDVPHYVTLSDEAFGAVLDYPPTTLDFGNVASGHIYTLRFGIHNHGNYFVIPTVTRDMPTDAFRTGFWTNPQDSAAWYYPNALGTSTEHWTFRVPADAPLCAPFEPTPTRVSGTSVADMPYSVPDVVRMGRAVCGGAAPSDQTFELHNPLTVPVTYSAHMFWGATSRFTMTPTSGTIPAGGSATFTVSAMAVPTNLEFTDFARLTPWQGGINENIVFDVAGGRVYVPVNVTPIGSVFEWMHTLRDFNLPLSGIEPFDGVYIHDEGICDGDCGARWSVAIDGPIDVFEGSWTFYRWQPGTAPGATGGLHIVDATPSAPICRTPPSPLVTWTAVP